MGLSTVLHREVSLFGRDTGISYRTAILLAAPVAVCAFGGYYYFRYYSKSVGSFNSGKEEISEIPKTPLEAAIFLKNKGNKFFKGTKYTQAIECYSQAIEKCPLDSTSDLATFYQNRAAARENIGQVEAAIEDCTKALSLTPRYLKALNRRAKLYETIDKLHESLTDATACAIFEKFSNIETIMFMERVLIKLANLLLPQAEKSMLNEMPSTSFIRNYLSAFMWDPLSDDSSILNAPCFNSNKSIVNGDSEELLLPLTEINKTLEECQNQKAKQFISYLSKGVSQLKDAEYISSDEALCSCLAMLESESKNELEEAFSMKKLTLFEVLAKNIRATYCSLCGKNEEAMALLDQILSATEEYKNIPVFTLIIVNSLIKRGSLIMTSERNVANCLSTFQKAESICPDCPDVPLHRGQIFILMNQLEDAINDFSRAAKLYPNSSTARSQRIFALYKKAQDSADLEECFKRVNDFEKLVKKYPSCVETRSLFAQLLAERMDFERSDQEFEELIKMAPDSGMFYGHRALLTLRWKQDKEAAKEILIEGQEKDPKCGMVHELIAQLYLEGGDFDLALISLEEAIKLSVNPAELQHLVALQLGAKAQQEVCEVYGISKEEIAAWHKACQEKMLATLQNQ